MRPAGLVLAKPRCGPAGQGGGAALSPQLKARVQAVHHQGLPITMDQAQQAAEAGDREGMVVYGIGGG